MRFVLDENFPKAAEVLLTSLGHDVNDVRKSNCRGANDEAVFQWAQEQKAIVLTTDRDFFHTIPHAYANHYGVVVIALRQPNRVNILDRLEWFLGHFEATDVANKVFQLRDRTYLVLQSS